MSAPDVGALHAWPDLGATFEYCEEYFASPALGFVGTVRTTSDAQVAVVNPDRLELTNTSGERLEFYWAGPSLTRWLTPGDRVDVTVNRSEGSR